METEIEKKIKEIAKIAPGKRGFCFCPRFARALLFFWKFSWNL